MMIRRVTSLPPSYFSSSTLRCGSVTSSVISSSAIDNNTNNNTNKSQQQLMGKRSTIVRPSRWNLSLNSASISSTSSMFGSRGRGRAPFVSSSSSSSSSPGRRALSTSMSTDAITHTQETEQDQVKNNQSPHTHNTNETTPRQHKNKKKKQKKKTMHNNKPKNNLGTNTAEWIVITGIPPLSTLDDLLPDIQRIFTTELQKGIIDLDRGEELLLIQQQQQQEQDEGGVMAVEDDYTDGDGQSCNTLKNEEWDEQDDINDTTQSLPLWIPSLQQQEQYSNDDDNDNDDDDQNLEPPTQQQQSLPSHPHHLVMEAHMMVSSSSRLKGWYLRLPNRSCVYALLQHLKEAQQFKLDFHQIVKEEQQQQQQQQQSSTATGTPEFSWDMTDTRPLTCAWKEVTVAPFNPNRRPYSKNNNNNINNSSSNHSHYSKAEKIWHQFHDGRKWGLGDNVIRVENCPMRTTEDDLRYLFNSYGLLDCRSRTTAVGSGVDASADDGVTFTHKNNNNINDKTETQQTKKQTLRDAIERIATNETVLPVTTKGGFSRTSQTRIVALHTYLVRFETAAGARAAVREKQSAEVWGGTVLLSRYSRQIVLDDVVV